MQRYSYPDKKEWEKLLQRPEMDVANLYDTVNAILKEIQKNGDVAVRKYSEQFDNFSSKNFKVTTSEIEESENLISPQLKEAIQIAAKNIATFHQSQQQNYSKIETQAGVVCWQKSVGIEKVGLYVPGGTAPLFSTLLMLAIPAKIAACQEVVLCTPPNKQGKIDPAILYAAKVAKVQNIYKVGGIQAIGAMAYGTESIPKVYKIFGPGNRYVTAAKQLVSLSEVAIDMPAGPSEVLIIADETAHPSFLAADLLSQAEHGADSQVILLTNCESILNKTLVEVEKQCKELPRASEATKALEQSRAILLKTIDEMVDVSNKYAPEHLILAVNEPNKVAEKIVNAGSVFLGHFTPESVGDYASGTNHTLPTNGYAKAYSGVNLDSYIRKITFQELSPQGLQDLGPTVEIMAEAEELKAHKNAVTIRLKQLNRSQNH